MCGRVGTYEDVVAMPVARRQTTKALTGLELPECFAAATVSAALNATDRETQSAKASRRRLREKAYRVSEVA